MFYFLKTTLTITKYSRKRTPSQVNFDRTTTSGSKALKDNFSKKKKSLKYILHDFANKKNQQTV